ncbi:MAG: hypothetical protein AAGD04_02195 [Pseudomonadota bacterium]
MPQAATSAFPPCLTQNPLPHALAEYDASAQLSSLGAAFEPLAMVGTLFDDALVTTQNSGALMSCYGGYAALQRSDMPLRLTRAISRADMRFAADQSINLTRVTEGERTSLIALNRNNTVQHRVQLTAPGDGLAARALERNAHCICPAASSKPPNVVSLTTIRSARQNWQSFDVGQHLNQFLCDRGQERHAALGHVGQSKAWEVGLGVLPSFVTFLCEKAVQTVRVVVGDGLLQMDVGALSQAETYDSVILATSRERSFAIDFSKVGSAWVTVSRCLSQLELYDDLGQGLAIIGRDPYQNPAIFTDMLLALPKLST